MLIAHRGFRTATGENRIVDFINALQKTPAVEFDIRLTKDDQVIIFHDDDFQRIASDKRQVADLTYQQIKNLAFFRSHPESLPPLFIESFAKEWARFYQVINVEIKGDHYQEKDWKILQASLLELQKMTKAEIIVSSFSLQILKWIAQLDKTLKKGYLLDKIENLDWELVKHFNYLHPSLKIATKKKFQKLMQKINLPLNIWTFKHNCQVKKVQARIPAKFLVGYISDNPNLKIKS